MSVMIFRAVQLCARPEVVEANDVVVAYAGGHDDVCFGGRGHRVKRRTKTN